MTNKKVLKAEKIGLTTTAIIAIATILTLLTSILGRETQLPPFFSYGVFVFLVISVCAIVYDLVGRPRPISHFLEKRKKNTTALNLFKDLKHFVDRVDELLSPGRNDNIHSLLNNLRNKPEFRDKLYDLQTSYLHDLFHCYNERVKRFDGTKEDLCLLISEFETFLRVYHRTHVRIPVDIIRRIGRDKIGDDRREAYKKYKEDYEHILRNYIDFGKKANRAFEEEISHTYFEMPEEL